MTAPFPYADLAFDGGFGEGRLLCHPCDDMIVRAHLLTPTEMTIGLWSLGKHCVGQGLLTLSDGRWTGRVSEYSGRWEVSMPAGSARLTFGGTAEAAP